MDDESMLFHVFESHYSKFDMHIKEYVYHNFVSIEIYVKMSW